MKGMACNDELICQQFARIIGGQEGFAVENAWQR